jgi:TfoX/Sxy family transcriptional regulator of competence genes
MVWKPAPPELVSLFDRVIPTDPAVERRKMFGYPAAFVNGNMFAGLHEDRLVLRLAAEAIAEAKQGGARDFEPMPGRAMRGWIVVPRDVLADVGLTGRWITRAFRHASEMPRKARKPKAKKAATGRR